MKKSITCGRAATLIGVISVRSLRNLCDSGAIPSFRLPAPIRADRKIVVEDLIRYLNDNNIPCPKELEDLADPTRGERQ